MKLAYVTVPGRGMVDELISKLVATLEADGIRLAGTVCARPADPNAHPCDMDLRILPSGPLFRISQALGSGAKGCRLDGGVIAMIGDAVESRLAGSDLLVVNKFGKLESQGRGLCPAISTALEMGIPTLVGANQMCLPDFRAFSDGMAVPLAPELHSIRGWFGSVQRRRALTTA